MGGDGQTTDRLTDRRPESIMPLAAYRWLTCVTWRLTNFNLLTYTTVIKGASFIAQRLKTNFAIYLTQILYLEQATSLNQTNVKRLLRAELK